MAVASDPRQPVGGFYDTFLVFLRIGLLSFGGPAAQISLMHKVLVDEREWLSERQFLNALSFCMLLPGPEAMQLATYAGWRLHGVLGGLMAGLLFVLPGALIIFGLASLYVVFGDVPLVDTLFLGIQAAAVVIVVEALLRISKRALNGRDHWIIAAAAFVAIYVFDLPYPLIVVAAGLYGALWVKGGHDPAPGPVTGAGPGQTALTIAVWLALWALPFVLLQVIDSAPILTDISLFFSKLAVVTFGGAYAVLAYMAQEVVTGFGWLGPTEMIDGLGLAETTPGPLILVTQFVGFVAAFHDGGFALAFWAGALTLWVTFVPCFLWIFVGGPYIEWISAQPRLSSALKAITAAVVGVILNLSLWFAMHVVFTRGSETSVGPVSLHLPDPTSINAPALGLIGFAGYLLLKRHMSLGWVLFLSSIAALAIGFATP